VKTASPTSLPTCAQPHVKHGFQTDVWRTVIAKLERSQTAGIPHLVGAQLGRLSHLVGAQLCRLSLVYAHTASLKPVMGKLLDIIHDVVQLYCGILLRAQV